MAKHAVQFQLQFDYCASYAAEECSAPVQVLRVIPYSAVQLYSYELFKRRFQDPDTGSLSVQSRLAAGACAGMASTVVRISNSMPAAVPALWAANALCDCCTLALSN